MGNALRQFIGVIACLIMANQVYGWEGAEPDLAGLWGGGQLVSQPLHGELTLDLRTTPGHARIGGFDVPLQRTKEEIRFTLPNAMGSFRGQLHTGTKSLMGHWIQPVGAVFSQSYATPVEFKSAGPAVWVGQVQPLEEQLHFYIDIHHTPEGKWRVVFRNPEFGIFGRGTWHLAWKDKEIVHFIGDGDGYTLPATYDSAKDRLLLSLNNLPAPLILTRQTEATGVGFYPRVPYSPRASYEYQPPVAANDGWKTGNLESVGLDPIPIAALLQSLLSASPADNSTFSIHSLLIARHGKLVLEEYFRGFDRKRPHDSRSAGKTFAPMLAGAAQYRGAKLSPSSLVYPYFSASPEKSFANWEERKTRLTLEHLMTMTPGLASDDYDDASLGGEDRMQSQTAQPDWYRFFLDLPVAHDPGGTAARYSSGSLNLVGGVVERAVPGSWNVDLFQQYIAQPLQFGRYHLNLMPTGSAYFGGGIYLLPRDSLKLGQVYLNQGKWQGRRIISESWARQSTEPHARFVTPLIDIDTNHQYGYGWHIYHFTVRGHTYRVYTAGGNGGQWVMVIPELDMVIGVNGGSYGNPNAWYRWGLEVLPEYLIPAGVPR